MSSFADQGMNLPPDVGGAIDRAAAAYGQDPRDMRTYSVVESSGNPLAQDKGSGYHGLFQLSDDEFSKWGPKGGSIWNPADNAMAAAASLRNRKAIFAAANGRDPSVTELYLTHQQGDGGAAMHLAHPDAPAWQNMYRTGEGQQKGPDWAKKAIWGNIPSDMRAGLDVNTVTSQQFMNIWAHKIEGKPYVGSPGAPTIANAAKAVDPVTLAPTPPDDLGQSPYAAGALRPGAAYVAPAFTHDTYDGMDGGNPLTNAEQRDQAAKDKPSGFFEAIPEIAKSDWVESWAMRNLGSLAPDPNYVLTKDRLKQFQDATDSSYWSQAPGATSAADLDRIQKNATDDMAREQHLANRGFIGGAQRLLMNALDPSAIGAIALTEGVGAPLIAAAKLGRIGRIAAQAMLGGVANGGYSALSSAVDPKIGHLDMLEAFGIGAVGGGLFGSLSRNPAVSEEAARIAAAGKAIIKHTGSIPETGPMPSINLDRSMGAGYSGPTRNPLVGDAPILDSKTIPTSSMGAVRMDSVGQLGTSENDLAKLVGPHLGMETVGNTDFSANPISAGERMNRLHGMAMGEWYATARPAFEEWAKDQGFNWFNRSKHLDEFNSLVSDGVEAKTFAEPPHPAVARATSTFREVMSKYADLLQNPLKDEGLVGRSVQGFENLTRDPNYFPKLADHEYINQLRNRFDDTRLGQFITDAVSRASPDMPPEMASRIGRGYLKRITEAGYGVGEDFGRGFSIGDREGLGSLLDELGVKGDDAEAILNHFGKTVDEKNPTGGIARSKRRTLLDHNYEAQGIIGRDGQLHSLRMKDFYLNDADQVLSRYSRQASGQVAMAQVSVKHPTTGESVVNGITGRADMDRLINQVKEGWNQIGADGKDPRLTRDVANLTHIYDTVTGKPTYNSSDSANQWLRRLREANFIRLMSNMGINQAQEFLKIPAIMGLKASLQHMPSLRRILVDGKLVQRNAVARELMSATGLGDDRNFGFLRHQAYNQEMQGMKPTRTLGNRIGQSLDRGLGVGKRITTQLTAMEHITNVQMSWAARAGAQRLADFAKGSVMRGREVERLRYLGLTPEMQDKVFAALRDKSEFGAGNQLHKLNLDKWDPQTKGAFVDALFRWSRKAIQENDIGGLNRGLSQPFVQVLTQFRSFMFGAWTKGLLHNIKHFDARTLTLAMAEMVGGSASYGLIHAVKGLGDPNQKPLTPTDVLLSGFSRAGASSMIPAVVDALLFATGNKQVFNYRSSGTPMDAIAGIPVDDYLTNLNTFVGGVVNSNKENRPMSRHELSAGPRLTPWGNYLPLTALFSHMISGHPAFEPKTRN